MTRRGRRKTDGLRQRPPRSREFRRLSHPFTPQNSFSDDAANSIHETALSVLEELVMRILLPEARRLLARAGAIVDEAELAVRIGRDIIAAGRVQEQDWPTRPWLGRRLERERSRIRDRRQRVRDLT